MFRKSTLKNGLRIIAVPQEGTQAVTVLVLVGTGSKYEKKEINGISHFLEHLFFKGTKKRPNTLAIAETLDRVGGIYNAFTSEEYTGYFAKVDVLHFDLALDVVSDILLNSKLEQKEIEKEKKVIFEEINMQYDHPISYVQILWRKLLYGDQPAGWDIAGTKESLGAISGEDLNEYLRNQYVASNVIVCIAGKIPALSKVADKVKEYFNQIKTGKPVGKPGVFEQQIKPQVVLDKRKTDQTHLCLGVRGYSLFHPQRYAQELLGIILGGMMSSRMFIEIRERMGIAYYIQTGVNSDTDSGFLVTQAGIDNKKVETAISSILKEYKNIFQKRISVKELKKAKDYAKGKMALLLEPSDVKASFYGLQELLENKILTPQEIYDKINKVTTEDILRTAQEIFKPSKLNSALIGPFEDKEKFEKILKL